VALEEGQARGVDDGVDEVVELEVADVVEDVEIVVEAVEEVEEEDVEFEIDIVALTDTVLETVELPVEEVGTKVFVVVLLKNGILLVVAEVTEVVAFPAMGRADVVAFPAIGILLLLATSVLLNEKTERRLLSPHICELLPAQLIPHATSTRGPKDCVAIVLPQKHSD